jgi:uncharacterized protein YhaN
MVIKKIIIKSFGMITDMTLEFSDGVNVVEGQNEAGKSTIAAFINYMLYGFGESTGDGVSERDKRINWETGVAQGAMYVEAGKKNYLISRSTVPTENGQRTTYKEEASIIDLETGAPAFGKMAAGEVFFGVDKELFENTAFVGQVGDSSINEGSVKESINNILFSGSEKINNQKAQNIILDKMHSLLHENGAGGAIVDIIQREEALLEKLSACEEDNRKILEKEAELHKIRERRRAAEEKLKKLEDVSSCYSNVVLIQTFDQLHGMEAEYEEKNGAYNKFIEENTKNGFTPDEQYLTDLALARQGVNDAYQNLSYAQEAYSEQKKAVGITKEIERAIELSDTLGGEKAVLARAAARSKHNIVSVVLASLGALLAVASGVIMLVTAAAPILWVNILLSVAALASISMAAFFGFDYSRGVKELSALEKQFSTDNYKDLLGKVSLIAESRAKRDALAVASENAKGAVARARENYEAAKRRLTELILRCGEEPPSSELSVFLDKLEARVKDFLDKKKELYEEKSTVEITVKEIRRTLDDKSEIDVRAQVSPLRRKALVGINYDEVMNGIADAKAIIAEEDRLALDVENELMALKARSGDPGEYYARINAIAERREELQKKHKAYFVALDAIKNASDNLRAEISPRLGEYATSLMGVMTDKKYSEFDVSDGLKMSFTNSLGEKKSIDFLSGGTKDMTYIAMRLALIDMLYKEKPPVVFDESFAHQDNVRATSMMRGIREITEDGYQSFIFTCRAREAQLAKEMIKSTGVFKLSVIDDEK